MSQSSWELLFAMVVQPYKDAKGRATLSAAHRVHDLYDAGLSTKQVAASTGLSGAVVSKIREGYSFGFVLVNRTRAREKAEEMSHGQ